MSKTESQGKKPDFGVLEEDDDFEEFPAEEWELEDEDPEDKQVWKDDWDDDSIEDSFSNQLRAEPESKGKEQGKMS